MYNALEHGINHIFKIYLPHIAPPTGHNVLAPRTEYDKVYIIWILTYGS